MKYLKFLTLLIIVCFLFPVTGYSARSAKYISVNKDSERGKEKQLPFKLLATILGSDSTEASCVMMNLDNSKQATYKIGDKIFDYQIALITRGSVTLLRGREFAFLNLPLGNENKPVNDDSAAVIKIRRSYIQKVISNLNSLLSRVSPVPFIESGKVIGLAIPSLNNKALQYLLQKTGLKEGDVATSVNGESINSLQKAFDLYRKLKDQEKISVEIKRGTVVKSLFYSIS
jgi:general secretion pathway protein C